MQSQVEEFKNLLESIIKDMEVRIKDNGKCGIYERFMSTNIKIDNLTNALRNLMFLDLTLYYKKICILEFSIRDYYGIGVVEFRSILKDLIHENTSERFNNKKITVIVDAFDRFLIDNSNDIQNKLLLDKIFSLLLLSNMHNQGLVSAIISNFILHQLDLYFTDVNKI